MDQGPIAVALAPGVHDGMGDVATDVPSDLARREWPLVCVVDDDVSVLRALRRLLRAGEFAVETFASAEAFLQSEHRTAARCVVLDIHLGNLTGFDVHERLAASGSRTPVVFITAHDDATTREQARRAGAVDYLRKPFDESAFLGAIARAIGEPQGDTLRG